MRPTIQQAANALQASWSAETAYDASDWSEQNPARGQCVVSSLVMQDYFGGELIRYEVTSDTLHETHYMNRLAGGTIIDVTASQYSQPVSMRLKPFETNMSGSIREKRLADKSTARRYALLKSSVEKVLATTN